jgi:hypothetical protein
MNTIIIVLAIIIIILVYVLFKYFSNPSSQLNSQASLKSAISPITSINSPTNTRYGYSIWVYINNWDNNVNKVIFSRAGNLKLYLSKSSPTLNLDVVMNDGTSQTMIVTNNFPIQKWCFIAISADNQYFDVYLDGKLVKSQRMYITPATSTGVGIMPAVPSDSNVPIYLGNSDSSATAFTSFDAFVASFQRYTAPIDPQTAWSKYYEGNGNNGIAKALSPYGVNLNILKNNVQQSQITLW